MQVELIETFLDLCETRSFRRTAERLGVTQSTVSGRVRALETAVGRRLLERSRSGTALTTEGLRFEPHARALRHGWSEALSATRQTGVAALAMRVGMQHDLGVDHLGDWLSVFRGVLPEASFYLETDYSTQMCADVATGGLDLAILYTPKAHPDLHFETLGEISYRMVSTAAETLAEVRPETYVLANYSPAFATAHAALHPGLAARATVCCGQNTGVSALLRASGGTAYVLDETARALVALHGFRTVRGARTIPQTVFAAVHLRNRHRRTTRRLMSALREHLAGAAARTPRRDR